MFGFFQRNGEPDMNYKALVFLYFNLFCHTLVRAEFTLTDEEISYPSSHSALTAPEAFITAVDARKATIRSISLIGHSPDEISNLIPILSGCILLEHLDLSVNGIGDQLLQDLLDIVPNTLKTLTLDGNAITSDVIGTIEQWASNRQALDYIRLAGNKIDVTTLNPKVQLKIPGEGTIVHGIFPALPENYEALSATASGTSVDAPTEEKPGTKES
jgi:hypothetical protein